MNINLKKSPFFYQKRYKLKWGNIIIGWRLGTTDFEQYLKLSVKRYYYAYISFFDKVKDFCDIGGFWGIFPLTLKELRFKVYMTEILKYYGNSFESLFEYLNNEGLKIIDVDPFSESFDVKEKFDIMTAMAILEHYLHSPKLFFKNILSIINKTGRLYIEVPNIAYYYKRKKLLFGNTPFTDIKDIYMSDIPFIGHHHEYTFDEIKYLTYINNLKIEKAYFYTYSYPMNVKYILKNPSAWLSQLLFKKTREIIAVSCTLE